MSKGDRLRRVAPFAVFGVALLLATAQGEASRKSCDWNDGEIRWLGYEEGIDRVRILGRPGVLLFYTEWCPQCQSYSRVFHDPRVVALAKRFVMIRVDRDRQERLNDLYGKHGTFVPRTLFLRPDGIPDWSKRGSDPTYPHYLSTDDPADVARLMRAVLAEYAS